MQIFPHNTENEKKKPRAMSAKGKFLVLCAIASALYLIFFFSLNAYADPPNSPYIPGETLNPNCPPTGPSSTDCTVEPPLFSTTTLPLGGVLYVSDTTGTITADTSSIYWNATSTMFQLGSSLYQTSTGTSLLLGPNLIQNGNASGTFLGANPASGFNGDFED